MLAFVIVVPLGILAGVIAALNVGRPLDRMISIGGGSTTVIPEFVSGIILILVFGVGLKWLPISATAPAGLGVLHLAQVPDHAGDPARADPVRLHRADGPRRAPSRRSSPTTRARRRSRACRAG